MQWPAELWQFQAPAQIAVGCKNVVFEKNVHICTVVANIVIISSAKGFCLKCVSLKDVELSLEPVKHGLSWKRVRRSQTC